MSARRARRVAAVAERPDYRGYRTAARVAAVIQLAVAAGIVIVLIWR